MPFTSKQITKILSKKGNAFIPANKMNRAGRICESYLRKKLYRWEDRSALAAYSLLKKHNTAIRDYALTIASQLRLTTIANDSDSIVYRRLLTRYAESQIAVYGQAVAKQAYQFAYTAFAAGWYGRLWMLDQASHHDPRVKPTRLPRELAQRTVLAPGMLTEAIYDPLEGAWTDTYTTAAQASAIKVKRVINSTASEPLGVLALTQAISTSLGVDAPAKQAVKGLYHATSLPTRTAVMRSANHASAEVYKEHTEMLLGAMWVTSHDERVCKLCARQDGRIFVINSLLGIALLGLPPDGTHMGCILPGNIVNAPGRILAAAKSFYQGTCIEVGFSDGRTITVTPNHPVRTVRGWVKAGDLKHFEKCYVTRDRQGKFLSVNQDNDNVPTAIEDVFEALNKSSGVLTRTVKATAEDFNGDGRAIHGDVDIVYTDRFLLGDIEAITAQTVSQLSFNSGSIGLQSLPALRHFDTLFERVRALRSDMGICQHSLFSGFVSVLPADEHAIGNITRLNSVLNNTTAQYISSNPVSVGEGLLGFASEVAVNDGFNFGDMNPNSTHLDTRFIENSMGMGSTDAQLAHDFLNRFASEIETCDIVFINQFDYSGYVYDLQTDPYQLYTCNGVIVHNCRCTVIPLMLPVSEPNAPPDDEFGDWLDEWGFADELDFFMADSTLESTQL